MQVRLEVRLEPKWYIQPPPEFYAAAAIMTPIASYTRHNSYGLLPALPYRNVLPHRTRNKLKFVDAGSLNNDQSPKW